MVMLGLGDEGLDDRIAINNLIDGPPPARFDRVRSLALTYIANLLTLSGYIVNLLTLLPPNEALS
jgi:hypothetical protein